MFRKLIIYFAGLLGSLIFFSIFVLVFLNGTQVDCSRQDDRTHTCVVQNLLLDRFITSKREIRRIVSVETFDDGCFDGCAYRTEFITANGETFPLTDVYTDFNPVEEQTTELRALLHSERATFEYHCAPAWWVAFLLGGLFLMDVFILTAVFGRGAWIEYLANRDALPPAA